MKKTRKYSKLWNIITISNSQFLSAIYSYDVNLDFQQSLLQSSVTRDPSEI